MSDVVIKAENLGKKYVIGHQAENGRYLALRDVLMHGVRGMWRKTKDLVRGKAIVQGDDLEEIWALRSINFEIPQGDVIGIIGRNGSGKSTLLKILSRITEPTEGRIRIRGRVSSLLEVGTGFHPELTGRENIFLNGAILGMTRAEIKRKFDEIVGFAEIEKFLDTPVKRYSSGMYVRLAFAVAAHLEPEILVVDEVLAVGDSTFQKKCLGKMGQVAKQGRTVLLVSHNMAAVRSLCHTGLMLSQGRAGASGPICEVVDAYLRQSNSSEIFKPHATGTSYLTGCETRQAQGVTTSTFFTDEEVHVVMCYYNRRIISGLRCGFRISTADGTVLACFTPEDEGTITPNGEGDHVATAIIPKNTLLKGPHRISVALWNPSTSEIYDDVDAIAEFTMEAAREQAYLSEFSRPGLFQASAEWSFSSGKLSFSQPTHRPGSVNPSFATAVACKDAGSKHN